MPMKLGRKFIDDWIPIRRGEGLITSLMFLYIFGALTAYYILKPLRSGLFLSNLPSDRLVYAYWLSALFAGTLAAPIFRLGRRVSAIAMVTATNLLIIATLFYFQWAMGREFRLLPYVYYVYVQVAPVLMVAQFWLLAGYIYNNRQAKRIYGLLGAGASTGALAGSFIVQNFRRTLGTEWLLLICICISGGLIAVSLAAWRHRRRDPALVAEQRHSSADGDRITDLVRLVFGSRHLYLMVALILLTMITSQLADWQIQDAVQKAFAGPERSQQQARIDEFFAGFNFYTNLLGIALQVFATGFVVRRFGIWAATLFLPTAVFVSSFGMLFAPALLTAVIVEGSDSVFRYSLNRAGLELLYMPLSPAVRKKIKLFIDVFIDRLGRAIAGLIIFGVTTRFLPLGLQGSSIAIICLTGASILICVELRRTYLAAFREQLARRDLDLSDVSRYVTEPGTIRMLVDALENSSERQVVYALRLLQSCKGVDFARQVAPMLTRPEPNVRQEAIRALAVLPEGFETLVEPLIRDSDPGVRQAAVDYVCARRFRLDRDRLKSIVEHENPEIRLAAWNWIAENEVKSLAPSIAQIWQLVSSADPGTAAARAAAAKLAVHLRRDDSLELLGILLKDPALEVRSAAARGAGSAGHTEFLFAVVKLLSDRELRPAAREALLMFGRRIAGTLGDLLADSHGDLTLRREIPWVLARLNSRPAATILVDQLQTTDPLLKFRVVKALNRMHESNPDLPPPNPAIAKRIYAETKAYYEALALWQAFEPDGGQSNQSLLSRALRERLDQNLEIIFRLLGLQYPQKDIYHAYAALRSSRADRRASALEFLDNLLHTNLKTIILPLLEEPSADRLISRASALFGIRTVSREEAVRLVLQQPDIWLKACALHEIGKECLLDLVDVCRNLSHDSEPLIRETAQWALSRCN
jgi:AAA family ATP:ADP antiporter